MTAPGEGREDERCPQCGKAVSISWREQLYMLGYAVRDHLGRVLCRRCARDALELEDFQRRMNISRTAGGGK
jgi:hypothetical protein